MEAETYRFNLVCEHMASNTFGHFGSDDEAATPGYPVGLPSLAERVEARLNDPTEAAILDQMVEI